MTIRHSLLTFLVVACGAVSAFAQNKYDHRLRSASTDLCGGCRVTGIPTATRPDSRCDFGHGLLTLGRGAARKERSRRNAVVWG